MRNQWKSGGTWEEPGRSQGCRRKEGPILDKFVETFRLISGSILERGWGLFGAAGGAREQANIEVNSMVHILILLQAEQQYYNHLL